MRGSELLQGECGTAERWLGFAHSGEHQIEVTVGVRQLKCRSQTDQRAREPNQQQPDVGAIPSVVGGHNLHLSHVGMVFPVNAQTLPRWRGWYRHLVRDQVLMWMPACFFGLALPSMLSVQFLPRGTGGDTWTAAGMTAGRVGDAVSEAWGPNAALSSG